MASDPGVGAQTVSWNLDSIYKGPSDPQIARDETEVDRLVEAFQAHRKILKNPTIGSTDVERIAADLERIRFLADRLLTYASLLASADQQNSQHSALYARLEERHTRWNARVVFAELALRRMPQELLNRLIESPDLARYRHFIEYQALMAPHTLSEKEEQVALKKNIAGRDANVRFREEFAARLNFGTLEVDGQERPMTMASLISLQEDTAPGIRLQARTRLSETFGAQRSTFAFLLGNVIKDHGIDAEMRGFDSPIDVENVPNEIPGLVVKNLLAAYRKHLPAMHDFYRWKAQKLGVARLRSCDLQAPIPGADPKPIPWGTAREAVEASFASMSSDLAREVTLFFEERRLDAAPRKGKRGGAFCAPMPGSKPLILLSYTGTLNTLITLTHELGHGVHFCLSGKEQTYIQAYNMSKVVAETASEFAECLLRDHLLENGSDPALRKKLLLTEVQRFIGTVFRQLFYTEFEIEAHERSAKEPLSPDTLSEIWTRLAREHYGENVELLEGDSNGWSVVGHFVFNPFYCYSYALSQVVVLALYRKWNRERETFLPRYLDILQGGWCASPDVLLKRAGIDLSAPEVMEEAFKDFEERIRAVKEAFD